MLQLGKSNYVFYMLVLSPGTCRNYKMHARFGVRVHIVELNFKLMLTFFVFEFETILEKIFFYVEIVVG